MFFVQRQSRGSLGAVQGQSRGSPGAVKGQSRGSQGILTKIALNDFLKRKIFKFLQDLYLNT
jgi:hypothetical protein